PDGRVADHMHVLVLHRLVRHVIDLAPALVRADQVGLDRDRPGTLGRDQVDDVILHPVAEVRRHLARGGIDLDDLVGRAVLEVRVILPRGAEERGLRDDVLVRVEHDELRLGLARLEVPRHLARALVRAGRAPVGDGRHREHEDAAVGHGLELPRELDGLAAGLPRVEHAVLCLREAVDLLPLELDARRDDEPIVLEVTVAHPDTPRAGLDRAGRRMVDLDVVAPETAVPEGEAVDRADAGEDEVAERARHELLVRLEQDDFDRGVGQPHVLRGRRAAPAAADHDDAAACLGREVALDRRRASRDARRGEEPEPGPRTRRAAASQPPRAKQAIAAQSFTWPSPPRQTEPAPQPPASVIPTPNARPPASAPAPAAGKTHSLLSLRSVNLRIANPSVLITSASAAARVCSASPVMNGSRNARTRQKRERWKMTPNATPKRRKTPCAT